MMHRGLAWFALLSLAAPPAAGFLAAASAAEASSESGLWLGPAFLDPCSPSPEPCDLAWAAYANLTRDLHTYEDLVGAVAGHGTDPAWWLARGTATASAVVEHAPSSASPPGGEDVPGAAPPLPLPLAPLALVVVPGPHPADPAADLEEAELPGLAGLLPLPAPPPLPASPTPPAAMALAGLVAGLGTLDLPPLVAGGPAVGPASPSSLPTAREGLGPRGGPDGAADLPLLAAAASPGGARPSLLPSALEAGSAGAGSAPPGSVAPWPGLPFPVGSADLLPAVFAGVLLLVPPLYHRLHKQRLLEHGARERLYRLACARPGSHIEELARAAGLSRSTAVYHLRLLVRHGLLAAMDGAKSVHYYPNDGATDPLARERRALLASPRARLVAAHVLARPGIQRGELAAACGITVSTLSWHLGRLLQVALVEDRLMPRGQRALWASPALEDLLRPWLAADPGLLRRVGPPAAAPGEPGQAGQPEQPEPSLAAPAMAFSSGPGPAPAGAVASPLRAPPAQ